MYLNETVRAVSSFANGDAGFAGLGTGRLEDTYRWPVPHSATLLVGDLEGSSIFSRTKALRRELNALWHGKPEMRRQIARWIVSEWGGVRGNRPATLEHHLRRAEGHDESTPFAGVSSYSKMLSVVDPGRYAILDARVVVSLNAVQVLAQTDPGLAFPYIPGRNRITGFQGQKQGFATRSEFSLKTLVGSRGWIRVRRNAAYLQYLKLLHAVCAENTAIPDISTLEMALFSQAEELALRADPTLADG